MNVSRRDLMKGVGAAALSAAALKTGMAQAVESTKPPTADQVRRMEWWHAAKFGMFIHFGLYAGHMRHEWAMEDEAIPVSEYQTFTGLYHPTAQAPRAW